MAYLIRVDGSTSSPFQETSMVEEGLNELDHLESWIKRYPEVIDPGLKVITTQFSRWESAVGSARERPDVLALADSGELVVIELKRDSDRKIHLQAITYGALVAGFTKDMLAEAHADWVRKETGENLTTDEALGRLTEHVESEWTESLFTLPRLVLVAEEFPGQVLTTVQWLATVAPDLTIACHEYHLFKDETGIFVSFQRIFPVDNLADRTLRPAPLDATGGVKEQLATNQRRAKSVSIIHEHSLIPEGAKITLQLETQVRREVVDQVYAWLEADPRRRNVTWVDDLTRPLVWEASDIPLQRWTPSALRNEIFIKATGKPGTSSAADVWCYLGRSLYSIASDHGQEQL